MHTFVIIKSIANFLIIFFIFHQLKSEISEIDKNAVNPFCDETHPMKVDITTQELCWTRADVIFYLKRIC